MSCTVTLSPRFSIGGGVSLSENKADTGAALNAAANVGAFSCKVYDTVSLVARPMVSVGVDVVAPTRTEPGARPWIGAGLQAGVSIAPNGTLMLPFELAAHASVTSRGGRVGGSVSAMILPVFSVYADYTADIASFGRAQSVLSHQISAGIRLGW
jgi:hypothetical protein